MIFKIRLPHSEETLDGLEEAGESRSDVGRSRLPKDHECSCLCSALEMMTWWNLVLEPIIIWFPGRL